MPSSRKRLRGFIPPFFISFANKQQGHKASDKRMVYSMVMKTSGLGFPSPLPECSLIIRRSEYHLSSSASLCQPTSSQDALLKHRLSSKPPKERHAPSPHSPLCRQTHPLPVGPSKSQGRRPSAFLSFSYALALSCFTPQQSRTTPLHPQRVSPVQVEKPLVGANTSGPSPSVGEF